MKKIIIGSAQFGNAYGISNLKKISLAKDIKKIVKICEKKKINTIDISEQYYDFKIKNKLIKKFKNKIYKVTGSSVEDYKIKINKILNNDSNTYCIMFHNPKILKKKYLKKLIQSLVEYKKKGKIQNIGISLYDKEEFWLCLKIFKKNIDIIQLPINILDRRFLDNKILKNIKKYKIEIHARSIFLQGLLLMNKRPSYFDAWKDLFYDWDRISPKKKLTACLNFVKRLKVIDKIILGFLSHKELIQILNVFNKKANYNKFKNFFSNDLDLINPNKWKANK